MSACCHFWDCTVLLMKSGSCKRQGVSRPLALLLCVVMIIGRQIAGSLIRGFDNLRVRINLTLTLTLSLTLTLALPKDVFY